MNNYGEYLCLIKNNHIALKLNIHTKNYVILNTNYYTMKQIDKIGIAADHAGYDLKKELIDYLTNLGYKVKNFGTDSSESVDYPDFAHPLAEAVENGTCTFGISICGSGNGISMAVNKHPKIRAALSWNEEISKLARLHNDANICSLPARFIDVETAKKIIDTFLSTEFEGGRHERRVKKISLNQ